MPIAQPLLEAVLERLDLSARPEATPEGLRRTYAAWCAHIPFDNTRKMIHIRSASSAPLPGGTAEDFFTAWLRHGTGGTCWANAGATHALLTALGFDAVRGVGTMLAASNIPPNHGTVVVHFGAERFLIDGSVLCGEPLPLDDGGHVPHPAWGVRHEQRDGQDFILWRPLHKPEGFECRLEYFDATAEGFLEGYEKTRTWSPFNYEVCARRNLGHEVIGLAYGRRVTLKADGAITSEPVSHEERNHFLVAQFGLSEELVAQIPPDTKTPPPPGSRSAQT